MSQQDKAKKAQTSDADTPAETVEPDGAAATTSTASAGSILRRPFRGDPKTLPRPIQPPSTIVEESPLFYGKDLPAVDADNSMVPGDENNIARKPAAPDGPGRPSTAIRSSGKNKGTARTRTVSVKSKSASRRKRGAKHRTQKAVRASQQAQRRRSGQQARQSSARKQGPARRARPLARRPDFGNRPDWLAIPTAFLAPPYHLLREAWAGIGAGWRLAGRIDAAIGGAILAVARFLWRGLAAMADAVLFGIAEFARWLPTRGGLAYSATFATMLLLSGLWVAEMTRAAKAELFARSGVLTEGPGSARSPAKGQARPAPQSGNPQDPILARIGGTYVYLSNVENAARLSGALDPEETMDPTTDRGRKLVDSYVDQKLLAEAAKATGLATKSDVADDIALARERILARAYLERQIDQNVTDRRIRAIYNLQADDAALGEEIRLRHILVETRSEALAILEVLDRGAEFATLARLRSLDRGTAPVGGDTGFITRDMVPEDFSRIAFAFETGETSPPFRTSDGWNIVQVVEKRQSAATSLADVRDNIARFLRSRTINETVSGLRRESDIELYLDTLDPTAFNSVSDSKSAERM